MQLTPAETVALEKITAAIGDTYPGSFSFSFTRRADSRTNPVTVSGQMRYTEEEGEDGARLRVPVLDVTITEAARQTIDPRKKA